MRVEKIGEATLYLGGLGPSHDGVLHVQSETLSEGFLFGCLTYLRLCGERFRSEAKSVRCAAPLFSCAHASDLPRELLRLGLCNRSRRETSRLASGDALAQRRLQLLCVSSHSFLQALSLGSGNTLFSPRRNHRDSAIGDRSTFAPRILSQSAYRIYVLLYPQFRTAYHSLRLV